MASKRIWDEDVSMRPRPPCGPWGLKPSSGLGSRKKLGIWAWASWSLSAGARLAPVKGHPSISPNSRTDSPPTDCQPEAGGTSLGTFALKYCLHMVGKLMSLFLLCVFQ